MAMYDMTNMIDDNKSLYKMAHKLIRVYKLYNVLCRDVFVVENSFEHFSHFSCMYRNNLTKLKFEKKNSTSFQINTVISIFEYIYIYHVIK